MQRGARLAALVLVMAAVAGCGFQLRGSAAWPTALERLELGGPELRLDLARVLRPALERAGAKLVDGAPARLEILAFDEERSLLAAAANSDVRENLLVVTVRYRLVSEGRPGDRETVSAERSYVLDPADITGVLAEERRLREGLIDEAVAALVRRLAASG